MCCWGGASCVSTKSQLLCSCVEQGDHHVGGLSRGHVPSKYSLLLSQSLDHGSFMIWENHQCPPSRECEAHQFYFRKQCFSALCEWIRFSTSLQIFCPSLWIRGGSHGSQMTRSFHLVSELVRSSLPFIQFLSQLVPHNHYASEQCAGRQFSRVRAFQPLLKRTCTSLPTSVDITQRLNSS